MSTSLNAAQLLSLKRVAEIMGVADLGITTTFSPTLPIETLMSKITIDDNNTHYNGNCASANAALPGSTLDLRLIELENVLNIS